jgi:MYXO-CTERM domain-containing protein
MQAAWDKIVADSKLPATEDKATCWIKPSTPPIKFSCAQIVADVPRGIEPLTQQNVCGPTYGCGATVAQRPLSEAKHHNDPAPAIAAALTLLGGLFALRRRRR